MNLGKAALLLAAGAALVLINSIRFRGRKAYDELDGFVTAEPECAPEENAETPDDAPNTQTCRAEILEARREMDPVTLQGWSRVTFLCEDGETRKMYFPGENGVYLLRGEKGALEHREGAFVSFEKDSGEIVGALYHIPAEAREE